MRLGFAFWKWLIFILFRIKISQSCAYIIAVTVFLISCSQDKKRETIEYRLTNLDITANTFSIRGVSIKDINDTFAQHFRIISKSTSGLDYEHPDGTFRAKLFKSDDYLRQDDGDAFYICINKKFSGYYDTGKVYMFRCDPHKQNFFKHFKREKARQFYYFYYLKM